MIGQLVRVLLISSNEEEYVMIGHHLSEISTSPFQLDFEEDHTRAVFALKEKNYDIYLLDSRLGHLKAEDILERARARRLHVPIIVILDWVSTDDYLRCIRKGATNCLPRGELTPELLEVTLRCALERRARDVREHSLRQRQVHESKQRSLGLVAQGLAVDYGNLLQVILGEGRHVLESAQLGDDVRGHLESVVKAACRAEELTRQLRLYAGPSAFDKSPYNLSRLVMEGEQPLKAIVGSRGILRLRLDERIPDSVGDVPKLREVISILVRNAAEAATDPAHEIEIRTRLVELDAHKIAEFEEETQLTRGRYAVLEVENTGSYIPSEHRAHIFDPYYSTRSPGRGVGLASALGIVRGHGGAIRILSDPKGVTCFRVYLNMERVDQPAGLILPRVAAQDGVNPESGASDLYVQIPTAEPDEQEISPPVHRAEIVRLESREMDGVRADGPVSESIHVLIVDDDEGVLSVAEMMLVRFGFEVSTAGSGEEALEDYTRRSEKIDLIILDIKMPGMSGETTLKALRHFDPDCKVLLSSGLTPADVETMFAGLQPNGYIQKPYRAVQLVQAVREAMMKS